MIIFICVDLRWKYELQKGIWKIPFSPKKLKSFPLKVSFYRRFALVPQTSLLLSSVWGGGMWPWVSIDTALRVPQGSLFFPFLSGARTGTPWFPVGFCKSQILELRFLRPNPVHTCASHTCQPGVSFIGLCYWSTMIKIIVFPFVSITVIALSID